MADLRSTLPPRRRSVGRPAIPVQHIIAAALRIVDERGADALSMRSVAQELNASTATLYRHFSSRAALVESVIDAVLGAASIGAVGATAMTWRQSIKTLAHSMFDAFNQHRNVAPLLVGYIPSSPHASGRREACISLLLEAGFPPDIAARAYVTLAHYILGFAIQLSANTELDGAEAHDFNSLGADEYPATRAVADFLPVALHDEFSFGLDLLIDALDRLPNRADNVNSPTPQPS